jgi:hypothetical protein
MEKFAFYMVDQLQFKLTPGQTLFDISKGSDRYVLYKVGPVISVSVSMFGVWFLVFNATLNNISVILWQSLLLVEETGVPGEKPPTCHKSLTNFITQCCIEYT